MAFIWFCIASRLLGDITRRCLQLQVAVAPHTFSGWWLTYPSEKYDSQLGLLFPIYGKKKHVQTTNQAYLACFFLMFCLLPKEQMRLTRYLHGDLSHHISAWQICQQLETPAPWRISKMGISTENCLW